MKRFLTICIVISLVLSFVGCSNKKDSNEIQYNDAASFEKALNDGKNVKGKVIQFCVEEYEPDSIWGYNCQAGEHLNFLFETEPDVKKGDIIVVRITEEPSQALLLKSWKIPCELLRNNADIGGTTEATTESSTAKKQTTQTVAKDKVVVTTDESTLEGMHYKEAEKKLREMGFENFEYKTIETSEEDKKEKICYVEIKEFLVGNSSFKKGDTFDADATIMLYYYEKEKVIAVSYSTNDYITAQQGNTGVFSYKNKKGDYDIYWIVDFDNGFVFFFSNGNGETTCDKVKIVEGDLNNKVRVTWQSGGDQWSWSLHFKYKQHPETLIVNDHYGTATEFTATNLEEALNILSTKEVIVC